MEWNNITHVRTGCERVASTYADIYFDDDHCEYKKPRDEALETKETKLGDDLDLDEWQSPSDHLIGIIELTPPFTSKITRGKTHQGILAIGDSVLARERNRFVQYMTKLLHDNDAAWNHILEHEKSVVSKKVNEVYKEILEKKSKIMIKEINTFYESTLQELEDHLRKELQGVLITAHANIISDLNTQIKEKLEKEKVILEDVLKQRYDSQVKNIKHYYKLLLENEKYRYNQLINQALHERNDALKAFYRQMEAENTTSTMYVMCTERKKCRIKQFLLDSFHDAEIAEKVQKIKEKQEIIDSYRDKERRISDINREWEDKIKKILQLFLKFISFSLKLLPEQTTFLLDLEKMVVLQLNEIQRSPKHTSRILIEKDEHNIYKFEEAEQKETVCDKKPFEIVGDTSEIVPTPHGSRETLASNIELPIIRVQRQFVYAKCDKFDEVKALLESQRCKCHDRPEPPATPDDSGKSSPIDEQEPADESESSNEPLLMDDIEILHDCPVRKCQDWAKKFSFPYLNSYLDFTEEKYVRVKDILGKPQKKEPPPELINPRDIVWEELPFSVTKEKYHHVGTQYSSQEDIPELDDMTCPCTENVVKHLEPPPKIIPKPNKEIDNVMMQRKISLQRMIQENPKLLQLFTDESFDFVYSMK